MHIRNPVRFAVGILALCMVAGMAGTVSLWLPGLVQFGTGLFGKSEAVATAETRTDSALSGLRRVLEVARNTAEAVHGANRSALQYLGAGADSEPAGAAGVAMGNRGVDSGVDFGARVPIVPRLEQSQPVLAVAVPVGMSALVALGGFLFGWRFGRSALVVQQTMARKDSRAIGPDQAVVNPDQTFSRVHYDN